jgi:hypothetical protein
MWKVRDVRSPRRHLVLIALAGAILAAGCGVRHEPGHETTGEHHAHKAAHGGCLSEIESCDLGHVETKLADGTLTLWFVGSGGDTTRAVRVPDIEVRLSLAPDGAAAREIVLEAAPIDLAGETVGHCSCFQASTQWLREIVRFEATGVVAFKGAPRHLTIRYPAENVPGHEHEHAEHK